MEVDVQLDLRESREPRDIHNGFRRGPAGQLRPRLRDCASYHASGDRQEVSSLHNLGHGGKRHSSCAHRREAEAATIW